MGLFVTFIDILFLVLFWAIIARAVLSWFNLRPDNPILTILYGITEPVLSPLRRIVPRIGMIDITPMVAIILILLIRVLIYRFS